MCELSKALTEACRRHGILYTRSDPKQFATMREFNRHEAEKTRMMRAKMGISTSYRSLDAAIAHHEDFDQV